MKWSSCRAGLGLLAVAAMTVAAGCAEEREPINRVQANALAKTFFVGADLAGPQDDPEFWAHKLIVDAPYGVSQSYIMTSGVFTEPGRIKWQITEDLLLGRLTYERVDGSDGKGVGPASSDGQIIVAFRIQSHFDIRRAYNPTTGEELNVIEENTTDRPWNEREYFRVDWSENLQTDAYDFDTLPQLGVMDGVKYASLAYYVNDPLDPDAPFFEPETGYFDITNKVMVTPALLDLSSLGWGISQIPACWLPDEFSGGTWPSANCNPSEITVRHAFRRVVDTDYEPSDWDGYRFKSYGAFYIERYGYERNYGMSDDKWHRLINRYNIWARSHYYDDPVNMTGEVACFTTDTTPFGAEPNRDEDENGTADECEDVTEKLADAGFAGMSGSQCDTLRQRCTLPYRAREIRPVVWYYSTGSNQEYFEGTEWAAHEWDVAIRHAIQVARYSECRATGGSKAECAEDWPTYFGQMEDNLNAMQLARDIDDCFRGNLPDYSTAEECEALADDLAERRGLAAGVADLAKMPEMVVLCHSPVEQGDHELCAPAEQRLPEGTTAGMCTKAYDERDVAMMATCNAARNVRRGDLRYHLVNVIEEALTPSSWGIYTDAHDPLSGETISAAINVYSHVTDLWSQTVIDRVRYLKGELSPTDVTEAEYIRDHSLASQAAHNGGLAGRFDRDTLNRRLAGFANATPEDVVDAPDAAKPEIQAAVRELNSKIKSIKADIDAPSAMAPVYEARRAQAVGSPIEAELLDPMMQQLGGVSGLPAGEQLHFGSPLQGMNPTFRRQLRQLRENALARHGACVLHEAPAPVSVAGLADQLEQKFSAQYGNFGEGSAAEQAERAEAMRKYLAQRVHMAVIVHEMGHSIGQRHNFLSSADAFSYRPQYWQLRTRNGAVTRVCGCEEGENPTTAKCENFEEDGSQCIGPRYFDPVTQEEDEGLIWVWMQDSVMDYAGDYTQDTIGIAAWDYASATMFYGDNVAVFDDGSYRIGTQRGRGALEKMDNFGGILGMQPSIGETVIHYSRLNNEYELIKNCREVNADDFKPLAWDTEKQGSWHPTLDGLIVAVDGAYTKCEQPQVDYVPWRALRFPTTAEGGEYYRFWGGPAIDPDQRVRVPYGFATDRWADLGNASVYRHDNGADVYEIFDFLISQQEIFHIFDNYRRHRQSFSLRAAAERNLWRYNEKIRDGAKGLTLYANIYRDFALEAGISFDGGFWSAYILPDLRDNVVAAGMTFDHFARTLARPEIGGHFSDAELGGTGVLRSMESTYVSTDALPNMVDVFNGATGYFGNVTAGGKMVENILCEECGEYDAEYQMNCGSYYDKTYAPYLMTESVDNFISDSIQDFVDGRYRACSLADLLPDGYRRWLANNLTGDDELKGPRLAADETGAPLTEVTTEMDNGVEVVRKYPTWPIGWTTWWTPSPETCFPASGTTVCTSYSYTPDNPFSPQVPDRMAVLDPQVGWDEQKFLINWTMLYLPENERTNWINMLMLWELGADSDPGIPDTQRIELHDPEGRTYVARTFGTEEIFGKTVQRGIAARVLEWANELLAQAYVVVPVDPDGDGVANWYEPYIDPVKGGPVVKFDPYMAYYSTDFGDFVGSLPDCRPGASVQPMPSDPTFEDYLGRNRGCLCTGNVACVKLQKYATIPSYLRQTMIAYGIRDPEQDGIWDY